MAPVTLATITPGPWTVNVVRLPRSGESLREHYSEGVSSVAYIKADTGHREIAVIYDEKDQLANARLMAAAPMMYLELALAADTFRDFANVLKVIGKDTMSAAASVAERHIREQLATVEATS